MSYGNSFISHNISPDLYSKGKLYKLHVHVLYKLLLWCMFIESNMDFLLKIQLCYDLMRENQLLLLITCTFVIVFMKGRLYPIPSHILSRFLQCMSKYITYKALQYSRMVYISLLLISPLKSAVGTLFWRTNKFINNHTLLLGVR